MCPGIEEQSRHLPVPCPALHIVLPPSSLCHQNVPAPGFPSNLQCQPGVSPVLQKIAGCSVLFIRLWIPSTCPLVDTQ